MGIRKAILAGSWYPDNASGCENEIKNFLEKSKIKTTTDKKLTGGIVPHAGWYFSGNIACNVINCLVEENPPDVFAVFGMHLHAGSSCYIMKEGAWETPFGEIEIESGIADELVKRFTFNIETPQHFIQDNTIELQLPFIKYFFENVKIVPIGVPPVKDSIEIGRAVAEISKNLGLRLKVIGSTDLTHYGLNYDFEPKGKGKKAVDWVRNVNDHKIIEAMLSMDPERVIKEAASSQNACCAGAAATAISAAKQLGAEKAELIAYATSYDIRPDNSFVGYAGVVF